MTRLPGDRAARGKGYGRLVDVARDFPRNTPEHKTATWFFASGAVSVRILGRVAGDLVEVQAAFR